MLRKFAPRNLCWVAIMKVPYSLHSLTVSNVWHLRKSLVLVLFFIGHSSSFVFIPIVFQMILLGFLDGQA